ncbi:queuosine precursor transporter [uncultured Duncaniella sp.]|uniref:queuosine precursor transporter n=1 Tax=uncultured Duncaniella sp. TaxID=2768039 RepID=UPI0023CF3827|nr:queuosine precursor transporter [uncultured Duncaniella sp.]MDE5664361.1 queuosine precursor transporter [Duncaniella sp.]MDE5672488.1 queuosine precursor transporter [Duncaniella sp.]MDE5961741.1 queuosine precursor transporter [Duncaniella sp.]MDE6188005.1 queuosine precursor transporter [Duncaniella sp.]
MSKVKISVTFMLLAVTFCVCLIVSNLMEIKTVDLGPLTITAGVVVFPISYILNDCIVEVYGFNKARLVIWLGFGMNMLVSLLLQLGIWLPGAESWTGQEAMATVFGAVPRIFAASFIAFLCGSMVNAYVMSRMKISSGGRRFSLRAIVSSLWGEGVDSVIFFPIAFAGVLSWNEIGLLIVTQTFLKTFYEILILPVTLRAVKLLRDHEGGDVTDTPGMSYKWWKINEI